jgi:hypothetical protein
MTRVSSDPASRLWVAGCPDPAVRHCPARGNTAGSNDHHVTVWRPLPVGRRLSPALALGDQSRFFGGGGEGAPGMLYVHPWEVDADQPRIPVSRSPGSGTTGASMARCLGSTGRSASSRSVPCATGWELKMRR